MAYLDVKSCEWNGYYFESRLHARWAVFFDSLKLRWEYKPEALLLPNGTEYTPHFYLFDSDMIVSVVSSQDVDVDCEEALNDYGLAAWPKSNVDTEQFFQFAEAIDHRSVLLCGNPGVSLKDYWGFNVYDNWQSWCQCEHCGAIDIQWRGIIERSMLHTANCVWQNYDAYRGGCRRVQEDEASRAQRSDKLRFERRHKTLRDAVRASRMAIYQAIPKRIGY